LTAFLLPSAAPGVALAEGVFPDVAETHVFRPAIEGLVRLNVINGNPDGTFRPGDPVNRAAMLKMLYLAMGKTPSSSATGCFPDVQKGSWYESYVCDAAAKGYVKGYVAENAFKPARPVSRAEALKITVVVMDIPLMDEDAVDIWANAGHYADVTHDAWYAPYVATAATRGILPLAGKEEEEALVPAEPIDRAEAAALIWNALQGVLSSASSASSEDPPAASSSASTGQASSRSQATFDDTGATADMLSPTFPFVDTQRFHGKKPFSYKFAVSSSAVAEFTVRLRDGGMGSLSCTLFRMEKEGFSTEYYLGYQENGTCYLRVAVRPGNYQLQLQPTVADTTYIVESGVGTGDGNDGFTQAPVLPYGKTRVDMLEANDLEDWFTFTVHEEQMMTVDLSSSESLRCLVYPSSDVDLFGFEGPSCGAPYLYPVGTYYVGVGHAIPKALKQTYTLELK
ncbi:MAG: S-layer homology domain-containing protein, partial [Patescibacteria group bacterium]